MPGGRLTSGPYAFACFPVCGDWPGSHPPRTPPGRALRCSRASAQGRTSVGSALFGDGTPLWLGTAHQGDQETYHAEEAETVTPSRIPQALLVSEKTDACQGGSSRYNPRACKS